MFNSIQFQTVNVHNQVIQELDARIITERCEEEVAGKESQSELQTRIGDLFVYFVLD